MQEQQFQAFPKQNAYRDDFDPSAPLADDPPWGVPIALVAWVASVLLIAFVPVLFLAPYLISEGVYQRGSQELARVAASDPTAIFLQMAAIIPAHLVTLFIGWAIVTKVNKHSFLDTLGWRSGGMRWWYYVLILVGFFAVAAVVTAVLPEQENQMVRILRSSRLVLYTVAALAVLTAPFVEELIYRGILYSPLQRVAGVPMAILIVTLLFAVVHFPQYWGTPSTIILLTLLSLTLTIVRAKTGNLLPCVILHTVFNGIQSLLMILSPEFQPKSTVPQDAVGALLKLI